MKTIEINHYHPFVIEYDLRFKEKFPRQQLGHDQHKKLINEWYNYHIEIDETGYSGRLTMSDEQYTIFLLKYTIK